MLTLRKKSRPGTPPAPVIFVSKQQFERLMGPDAPSEVPDGLRRLVLQQRDAQAR